MRRCLIGDLIESAAIVAAYLPDERPVVARALIAQADAAHRYTKKLAKAHPIWGNGSLMASALAQVSAQRFDLNSESALAALAVVAACLADHKAVARHRNAKGFKRLSLSEQRQIC